MPQQLCLASTCIRCYSHDSRAAATGISSIHQSIAWAVSQWPLRTWKSSKNDAKAREIHCLGLLATCSMLLRSVYLR